jgi:cellulose biosynthesis protein BcsQ
MKFPRPKKVMYTNNKGGVGKTTLAFNTAVSFAKKGYNVMLVDLDPQCNLSCLALGYEKYEKTLFSSSEKTIYDALRGVIDGGADVDFTVAPIRGIAGQVNLSLVKGSINLSLFEDQLATAYGQAAIGQRIGYFVTSAIHRYILEIGIREDIDIFVIDTSPTLGLLNRTIFLGTDYFVVPLRPDVFSIQGIENMGTIFERWKRTWSLTAKSSEIAQEIENKLLLPGDPLFIGYVLNEFNVYDEKPVKNHEEWMKAIPELVKVNLSEKHCRNGLVEKSYKMPLGMTQDFSSAQAISQQKGIAIFDVEDYVQAQGTKEVVDKAKEEYEKLSDKILAVLSAY